MRQIVDYGAQTRTIFHQHSDTGPENQRYMFRVTGLLKKYLRAKIYLRTLHRIKKKKKKKKKPNFR